MSMVYFLNAYASKDLIKEAGGRWHPDGKYWSLTSEQFQTVDQSQLDEQVHVIPEPAYDVSPINSGDEFRLVRTDYLFGIRTVRAVTTDGRVLAWWKETEIVWQRKPNSYYNRHRIAKGDLWDCDWKYEQGGATEAVLNAVQEQLPQAFIESGWTISADDDESRFGFLKGICEGGCAWYMVTPKTTIKALKKAQKTAVFHVA